MEKVGVIRRGADGGYTVELLQPQQSFHCAFFGLVYPLDADVVAIFHTHPFLPEESILECGLPDDPPRPYRPHLQGGGSWLDWFRLGAENQRRADAQLQPVRGFILDKQNIYLMPAGVAPDDGPKEYKYWPRVGNVCKWI